LDETGPEKLLVYRLQKRYNDIARCMQITADLQLSSMTNMVQTALDYVPQLDEDEEEEEKSLSMFTDGLIPCYVDRSIVKTIDYEHLLDQIKVKIKANEEISIMHGQIDGIADDDEEKDTKPVMKKREFFVHSTNNFAYSSVRTPDLRMYCTVFFL
jgi:hypothetical protein